MELVGVKINTGAVAGVFSGATQHQYFYKYKVLFNAT